MSSSDEKSSGSTRRNLLKSGLYLGSAALTTGLYRLFRRPPDLRREVTPEDVYRARKEIMQQPLFDLPDASPERPTPFESVAGYNNFYEFSTDKEAVAARAEKWKPAEWTLRVEGLVERPLTLSREDLAAIPTEDRVYRFRCVEGWSMVIPWRGFPLARLLERARPTSQARYAAFESFYDEATMPYGRFAGIPFPYVEGLRLDEALHPLTLLATGLYGRDLPSQNGAPVRLVVPWKYGFKSIKSVIKISLVDRRPPTTWNVVNPAEYGFYSNVNPEVDHPRWSQKRERRIGETGQRETLMFNGYEKQVGRLYAGMDLKAEF